MRATGLCCYAVGWLVAGYFLTGCMSHGELSVGAVAGARQPTAGQLYLDVENFVKRRGFTVSYHSLKPTLVRRGQKTYEQYQADYTLGPRNNDRWLILGVGRYGLPRVGVTLSGHYNIRNQRAIDGLLDDLRVELAARHTTISFTKKWEDAVPDSPEDAGSTVNPSR